VCELDDYDQQGAVGLRENALWTAEDQLVKLGVDFARGEIWKPFAVVDRDLYTGQKPASAAPLAKELLKVLNQ
jgi:putative intracellular protease/amidase